MVGAEGRGDDWTMKRHGIEAVVVRAGDLGRLYSDGYHLTPARTRGSGRVERSRYWESAGADSLFGFTQRVSPGEPTRSKCEPPLRVVNGGPGRERLGPLLSGCGVVI